MGTVPLRWELAASGRNPAAIASHRPVRGWVRCPPASRAPATPSARPAAGQARPRERPGVAASILEGLDEMLTVNRLDLPAKLRACTNSIENMMATVRRVCHT